MADQAAIDSVGGKFQAWASSLPAGEQEALAEWWSKSGGNEVSGYSANWWQADNAWSGAWNAWWSE